MCAARNSALAASICGPKGGVIQQHHADRSAERAAGFHVAVIMVSADAQEGVGPSDFLKRGGCLNACRRRSQNRNLALTVPVAASHWMMRASWKRG